MFHNKDGNKILLELMEKNENTLLREKIYNILSNRGEISKFYHERWDLQKGIKSGPVGYEFKTFTEADNHNQQKSKNQSNGGKKKKKWKLLILYSNSESYLWVNFILYIYSQMIENSSALKKHFLSSILPYQGSKEP